MFQFSTDGYHFHFLTFIEKIKTKNPSPPKKPPLLRGELAKRQNCEGNQKTREAIPQVCVSHVRLA